MEVVVQRSKEERKRGEKTVRVLKRREEACNGSRSRDKINV